MPPKSVFVLDTSALLALRSDESGADRVETVIQQAKRNQVRLLVSFMTRMEVLYRVWREEGHEAAREALSVATAEAVQHGLCGAPSFRVDGALFWGQDRLKFTEMALRGWKPAGG